MAEKQIHGFNFEKLILNNLFTGYKGKYTDIFDIPKEHSGVFNNNISIKSIGIGNAVELGSALRFYKNKEPFVMIIGWHLNKKIQSINEYLFSEDILEKLKGDITLEIVEKISDILTIKNFPVGKHLEARNYFKQVKKEYKKDFGLLTLTGKVDSKIQRRWQCNINNTNFEKLFGKLKIQKIYNNIEVL